MNDQDNDRREEFLDDDFARFRAERLANRRPAEPAALEPSPTKILHRVPLPPPSAPYKKQAEPAPKAARQAEEPEHLDDDFARFRAERLGLEPPPPTQRMLRRSAPAADPTPSPEREVAPIAADLGADAPLDDDVHLDDDFARFRAERLAKRPSARLVSPAGEPASAPPEDEGLFFGTTLGERAKIRAIEAEERCSSEVVPPARSAEPEPAPQAVRRASSRPGLRSPRGPVASKGKREGAKCVATDRLVRPRPTPAPARRELVRRPMRTHETSRRLRRVGRKSGSQSA